VKRSATHLPTNPFQAIPAVPPESSLLQCCIAYNAHGGYCVPLSSRHRPAAQKILAGQVYEPQTIEFISKHAGSGDIVHAGTYFGDFLPALSRACVPGSKVWACEPNPESYRCATITCLLNGLENVLLTNAALGELPDSRVLLTANREGRALGGASQLLPRGTPEVAGRTQEVQIVTIDDLVPTDRTVSILQLDVEGHERQALSGALQTIQRTWPILILEKLPDQAWLSENILRLGYRPCGQIHGNTLLMRS
jgi:FkbM family methyltransferase